MGSLGRKAAAGALLRTGAAGEGSLRAAAHLNAPTTAPEAFRDVRSFVDKGKPRVKSRLDSSSRTGLTKERRRTLSQRSAGSPPN